MSTRKTTPFFYEGMIFVCSDGSVYREVSREDIVQRRRVYSLPVKGLQYTSVENLLREVSFPRSPLQTYDGAECVQHDGGEGIGILANVTPTDVFTGASRVKGSPVDVVYVTPVTVAVPDECALRSSH